MVGMRCIRSRRVDRTLQSHFSHIVTARTAETKLVGSIAAEKPKPIGDHRPASRVVLKERR
jgi:hypothetical protein